MVAREQVRVELRRLDNSTLSVRDPQSSESLAQSTSFVRLPCTDNAPVSGAAGQPRFDADGSPHPLYWRVRRHADVPGISCRLATPGGGRMAQTRLSAHRADDLAGAARLRRPRRLRHLRSVP